MKECALLGKKSNKKETNKKQSAPCVFLCTVFPNPLLLFATLLQILPIFLPHLFFDSIFHLISLTVSMSLLQLTLFIYISFKIDTRIEWKRWIHFSKPYTLHSSDALLTFYFAHSPKYC